tara:strand:+ start:761 stop:1642 length:882 start_codon:yes stop_codon:yes gene_type:complete
LNLNKSTYLNEQLIINLKPACKVGLAAGLDKNGDYIDSLSSLGFGFLEVGTVTPRPQPGNPKPRLLRIKRSKALVNKMGFNNKGVDHLVSNLKKRKTTIPIGVSIGKNFDTPNEVAYKDYIYCLDRIYEYSDYIAINISSPNTEGLRDLESKKELENLLSAIKQKQMELADKFGYRPLFLKISPDSNKESVQSVCEAIKSHRIDGLICTNTTTDHVYFSGSGGLSGKPLMGPSTTTLRMVRKFLGGKFPIIASGGVMSKEDYQKKIDAGADLVQIYTGFIYEGPKLIDDILNK